jgi:mono/diheme cytochrome c family protein
MSKASPKKQVFRWVFYLLLAFSAFLTVLGLTTPGYKPVFVNIFEPATIQADQTTLDIGRVPMDSKVKATYHLYNVGGKPLLIKGVDTSCGCTAAQPKRTHLRPGQQTPLEVTLDTSIKLGHVEKTITVASNDPKTPELVLKLTGVVFAPKTDVHGKIAVKDPLVLFRGECAECHVKKGIGKTGMALFRADCGMCHGAQAEGGVASGLLRYNYQDPAVAATMRKIIAEGMPNNPEMPPFSQAKGGPLTEAEIDSLMTFLRYQADEFKAGRLEIQNDLMKSGKS